MKHFPKQLVSGKNPSERAKSGFRKRYWWVSWWSLFKPSSCRAVIRSCSLKPQGDSLQGTYINLGRYHYLCLEQISNYGKYLKSYVFFTSKSYMFTSMGINRLSVDLWLNGTGALQELFVLLSHDKPNAFLRNSWPFWVLCEFLVSPP